MAHLHSHSERHTDKHKSHMPPSYISIFNFLHYKFRLNNLFIIVHISHTYRNNIDSVNHHNYSNTYVENQQENTDEEFRVRGSLEICQHSEFVVAHIVTEVREHFFFIIFRPYLRMTIMHCGVSYIQLQRHKHHLHVPKSQVFHG